MGRLGPGELFVILVIALLFFGPAKLPGLGKAVGEAMREFQKGMRDARQRPDNPGAGREQRDDPAGESDRRSDEDLA